MAESSRTITSLPAGYGGQVSQALLEHIDVVAGSVGAGVARPLDGAEHFVMPVAAVQPSSGWNPNPPL